jgi:Flp pilus assembly protein TadD
MNNLALTLYAQGDLAGARKLQEQVLEAWVRLLGKEHPDTLRAMNNLAGTLYAQGDLAGARKLEEQVLEARGRLLGKEHPDTLTAMNNLAQTLKAEKDLARTVQAENAPSSQPSTKVPTGRLRMISNFWRLCGGFFRGSASFRSKKAP